MRKAKLQYRITNLDSKTRKGTYLYIRLPGQTEKAYKIKPGQTADPIIQYYKDKYYSRKPKGTLQQYQKQYSNVIQDKPVTHKPLTRATQAYIKEIRKKPKLLQNIKAGITTTVIKNALHARNTQLKHAKKQLFQTLVHDKDLLNLLIKEENTNKLAYRFGYKIQVQNKQGQDLQTLTTYNQTPETVITQLQSKLRTGMRLDTEEFYNKIRELKSLNYNAGTPERKGTVNNIKLTIVFRKAI